MIDRFHHDEAGYEAWLARHPGGYVFNHFGGRDRSMNLLHRAACPTLHRIQDARRRTIVPKICSASYIDLIEDLADRVGKEAYRECAECGG